jgi:hypothetical protein
MKKIDVCINVYGKPYQTILTLKSLLKHSSQHIDKIYFIEENQQRPGYDFDFISKNVGYHNMIRYIPQHYLWVNPTSKEQVFSDENYRLSCRYEYGLSNSDKSHMLLIHNDVLFHSDIVGKFFEEDENYFGIGLVGQCWNCPLNYDNICSGERLEENLKNQNFHFIFGVVNKYPNTRLYGKRKKINVDKPLPLSECRINEWCMFINLNFYRDEVLNKKEVVPIGGNFLGDIGDLWFRQMVDKGYKFKHFNIDNYYTHAYFSNNANGHSALLDQNKYDLEESLAKKYLEENF